MTTTSTRTERQLTALSDLKDLGQLLRGAGGEPIESP